MDAPKRGKHDRASSEWEKQAKELLEKDIDKDIKTILHEIYEQHEKARDYRYASLENEYTKHVPIEIQLLTEKKMACFNYKISERSEKQTNKIIWLTRWLVMLTFVLAVLTAGLIYQGITLYNKLPQKSNPQNKEVYFKNEQTTKKDTLPSSKVVNDARKP